LEETAAIGGNGGDEEGSDFLRGSLHRSKLGRGAAGGKITSVWFWVFGSEKNGSWTVEWDGDRGMGECGLESEEPAAEAGSLLAFIPWPEGHGFYVASLREA